MTNRRSLQTNMQRISRAQQFVPGHVGGRVASAQPVNHRTNRVGATQRPADATPPTSAYLYKDGVNQDSGISGATYNPEARAVAAGRPLVAGQVSVVSIFSSGSILAPSGWRVLGSGAVGSYIDLIDPHFEVQNLFWLVAVSPPWTYSGSWGGDFDITCNGQNWWDIGAYDIVDTHYIGASGGVWNLNYSEHSVSDAGTLVSPSPDWVVREMRVGASGSWTSWTLPGDDADYFWNNTFHAHACWPYATGDDVIPTGDFADWYRADSPNSPPSGEYTFDGGGIYGQQNSVSMAIGWTP